MHYLVIDDGEKVKIEKHIYDDIFKRINELMNNNNVRLYICDTWELVNQILIDFCGCFQ